VGLVSKDIRAGGGNGCTNQQSWSGRIEARPDFEIRRFLDPPYHSVRRVFPRYGWKAGISGSAFLDDRQLKLAPSMRRPISSLHPPFVHLVVALVLRSRAVAPALCREADAIMHHLEEFTPPP
jgi:hypothetical protein